MKIFRFSVILFFSFILILGCGEASFKPIPAELEKALIEKMEPAMNGGKLEIDRLKIIAWEGNWAKVQIELNADKAIEYFYFQNGSWHYANLVGGMNEETAKELKVPRKLWPKKEKKNKKKLNRKKVSFIEKEELEEIKKRANDGNGLFMRRLGLLHLEGKIDGKPNYLEAEKWLKLAAQNDSPLAAFVLAELYRRGEYPDGLKKNMKKARHYYELSAGKYSIGHTRKKALEGSGKDAVNIGDRYYWGEEPIVKQDRQQALRFYKLAVEAENAEGAARLASIYRYGYLQRVGMNVENEKPEFETDLDRAIKYEKKAALLGDWQTAISVSENFLKGRDGYPKDWAQAEKFLKIQLESDDPSPMAIYKLAKIYLEGGHGVSRNLNKAKELSEKLLSEHKDIFGESAEKLLKEIEVASKNTEKPEQKKNKNTSTVKSGKDKKQSKQPEKVETEIEVNKKSQKKIDKSYKQEANKSGLAIYSPNKFQNDEIWKKMLSSSTKGAVRILKNFNQLQSVQEGNLLLYLPESFNLKICDKLIKKLRKSKVIGIGYGASQLFKKVGLLINDGNCAHFSDKKLPEMLWKSEKLLPKLKDSKFTPYSLAALKKMEPPKPQHSDIALHIPAKHHLNKKVDAIARLTNDTDYAPIARQGNFLLMGFSRSPEAWNEGYRNLFSYLVKRFLLLPDVPFSTVERETTPPGNFYLKLGKFGNKQKLAGREFYFRFKKPVNFSASLKVKDSNNIMLLFMGENKELWTRKNGRSGDILAIETYITPEQIQKVGSGYWMLKIANFDKQNSAEAKLSIDYQ